MLLLIISNTLQNEENSYEISCPISSTIGVLFADYSYYHQCVMYLFFHL